MNILHIVNGFNTSRVHSNLYNELDNLGVNQIVFIPTRIRQRYLIGKNEYKAKNTQFIYADVVKPIHHYFYHIKRKCVYKALLRSVNVNAVNLVHAATLMSDGGIAYLLYKNYNIPYVVSIRNTDINVFFDKMPHTWKDAKKILLSAKRVFFISQGLKEKFENHRVVKSIISLVKDRFVLIPNGIDKFYISNVRTDRSQGHGVIYIGNFSNNKNILRLGKAILQLQKEPQLKDITLTIVGGGNSEDNSVEKMIKSNEKVFRYVGQVYDKTRVCELLRQNRVFAMPSINETFGLVYLEALSQNLPVLYTKGQGIDGLFDDSVGIGVNPLSIEDIADALRKMLLDTDFYSNKSVNFSAFLWSGIAEKYREHYRELLGHLPINQSLLDSFKILEK